MLIPSSLAVPVLYCLWWFLAAFGGFRWSGRAWCARLQLEETGYPWAFLNVSRSFGLRHVLSGHPCSHQVSLAHGGSWIDAVEVREQLGGQGRLCVEVCCFMGRWYHPIAHWWVVFPVFHGWSKVWVVE